MFAGGLGLLGCLILALIVLIVLISCCEYILCCVFWFLILVDFTLVGLFDLFCCLPWFGFVFLIALFVG